MSLTGIFDGLTIASSGMSAQRERMNLIASNIANANTMESSDGGPYKRKSLNLKSTPINDFSEIFSSKLEKITTDGAHFKGSFPDLQKNEIGSGVKINSIKENNDFTTVYDPSSPYANKDGYVKKPNIKPINEMVKMIEAQRAFEANATSFNSVKAMMQKSLEII